MLQQIVYAVGRGLCHQIPARSFISGGVYYPVCARDCGIYLGLFIGLLVMAWMYRHNDAAEIFHPAIIVVAGLMFVPLAFDGITSYAGLRTTTNLIRFLTGFSAGYAAGSFLFWAIRVIAGQRNGPQRLLGTVGETAVWLASGAIICVVAYLGIERIGVVGPLLMVAVIIVDFWVLTTMVLLLFPSIREKMTVASHRRILLVGSLLLSITIIALLSLAKQSIIALL